MAATSPSLHDDTATMDARNKRIAIWNRYIKKLESAYKESAKPYETGWARVNKGRKLLQAEKDKLAELYGGSNVTMSDVFHINAGGEHLRVSRSTLTLIKGSRLAALFSGRWDKKLPRDSSGRVFLDVNPVCFKAVVKYLNQLKISSPGTLPVLPRADTENQVFLNGMLTAFGLEDVPHLDSDIVVEQSHLTALIEFLDEGNQGFGLSLLYRGSRDGMNAASFHEKCDSQGPTLTIVRSTEGYIFGGYADRSWTSAISNRQSDKSFIFGLHCHGGSAPVKMEIKPGHHRDAALVHSPVLGPTFGWGRDLYTFGWYDPYCEAGNSYQLPLGADRYFFTGKCSYALDEVEVFKVDKDLDVEAHSVAAGNSGEAHGVHSSSIPGCDVALWLFQEVFQEEIVALAKATKDLAQSQHDFAEEKMAVEALCPVDDEIFLFNATERQMAVKHSTLAKYPDSLLYKHLADPNWKGKRRDAASEWDSEQVAKWCKSIDGLPEDISASFEGINGAQVLALQREDVKELGIKQPELVALVVKAIQELRKENDDTSTAFIEYSDYHIGKIIDVMRLKAMAKLGVPDPQPHKIRTLDDKGFETLVKYFFQDDAESVAHFVAKAN